MRILNLKEVGKCNERVQRNQGEDRKPKSKKQMIPTMVWQNMTYSHTIFCWEVWRNSQITPHIWGISRCP